MKDGLAQAHEEGVMIDRDDLVAILRLQHLRLVKERKYHIKGGLDKAWLEDELKRLELQLSMPNPLSLKTSQVPALLVVTKAHLTIRQLLAGISGKKWHAGEVSSSVNLDSLELEKKIETGRGIYAIGDLRSGHELGGFSLSEAKETLSREFRRGLTVEEAIAFLTHFPEFFSSGDVIKCLCSRHSDQEVESAEPSVEIWILGRSPTLRAITHSVRESYKRDIFPSCKDSLLW